MRDNVKRVLKTWKSSLLNCGKIDSWKLEEDLVILNEYLNQAKEDCMQISYFIEILINRANSSYDYNPQTTVRYIYKVLNLLGENDAEMKIAIKKLIKNKKDCASQRRRYKGVTQRIFNERLRFKDGMKLRHFDIDTESASDSRIVRRIIEKRMCQAYYNMSRTTKLSNESSNRDRYKQKRATQFQLFNIGQVEGVNMKSRGDSTHWKRKYDAETGQIVFKKKMAYKTYEEALDGINIWKRKHPYDHVQMAAYRCSVCGSWHIGHNYPGMEHEDKIYEDETPVKFYRSLVPPFAS